jgi:chlorite dismutase
MAPIIPMTFLAGASGRWRITRIAQHTGPSLPPAARLEVHPGHDRAAAAAAWALRGSTGHQRYVEQAEKRQLVAVQAGLERKEATCAALIPIRKSAAWWELAQDERRKIFEEVSRHTAASMKYLPAIARRLYHSRELGEPFDFLTWFEFAPEHAALFEELVGLLRATEEWTYVEREVDLRLTLEPEPAAP